MGLDIDIVSTYGQLATVGALFLAAAALHYAVGRPSSSGGPVGAVADGDDQTVASALTSAVHLLSVVFAVVIGASVAGFRGALAGSTLWPRASHWRWGWQHRRARELRRWRVHRD